MLRELRSSLLLLAVSVAMGCLVYPTAVYLAAHALAPREAQGSLLTAPDGTVVGSRLIAQGFTNDAYFWPRPSAVSWNAAAAGARSHAPTGAALRGEIWAAYSNLVGSYQGRTASVPADLITASASGLDPDISGAAARCQEARVASARRLSMAELDAVVVRHLRRVPGAELVNVLALNLELDRAFPAAPLSHGDSGAPRAEACEAP